MPVRLVMNADRRVSAVRELCWCSKASGDVAVTPFPGPSLKEGRGFDAKGDAERRVQGSSAGEAGEVGGAGDTIKRSMR